MPPFGRTPTSERKMRSRSYHVGLAVFPALLLLGACGTDLGAPSEEDQQINLDVAAYAADAAADDIVLMTTEADVALNPNFHNEDGCTRVVLFRIRCPQRHFGDDINYTREVTFLDENLDEMEFFHRDSTEAVNIFVTFEGSRTREDVEITVDRQRDITVSNLFGIETERIWNGTGSSNVERIRHADDGSDRVYDFSSTSTVDSVIIAVPRQGTWPLSGTISREVYVEVVGGLKDDRTRYRTVVIEFNGTQFATTTINGETFTFDLETRTIVRD
jgi:hypothetical protein